jgi:hypothetical protein
MNAVFESGAILRKAAGGKFYRVGVFPGATGSGKTTAMLVAAVEAFKAEVVNHFRGALLAAAIAKCRKSTRKRSTRDNTVCNALLHVIDNIEPLHYARQRELRPSSATVVIVLDEMGPYKKVLRDICADLERIARAIAKRLSVHKFAFLCGGSGLDTVEYHEGSGTATSALRRHPATNT